MKPQLQAIFDLPKTVFSGVITRLKRGDDVETIAEWARKRGHEVNPEALGEFGEIHLGAQRRAAQLKYIEQQAPKASQSHNPERAASSHLLGLLAQSLLDVKGIRIPEQAPLDMVMRAMRVLSTVERNRVDAELNMLKLEQVVREKADQVRAMAQKGGTTKEAVQSIYDAILGITADMNVQPQAASGSPESQQEELF